MKQNAFDILMKAKSTVSEHKIDTKKPKIADMCNKMTKMELRFILDDISDSIYSKGIRKANRDHSKRVNLVNEQASDYDNKYFDQTGFTRCTHDSSSVKCYCAKCLMEEMIGLDMQTAKTNIIRCRSGKIIRPVCRHMYEPIVVKRGDRYYLLARSEVKHFNIFYPISGVLKDFY